MTNPPPPVDAATALERLAEGNRRFRQNLLSVDVLARQVARADVAQLQRPMAIVLCCSDARVPAEIVFDQGIGDLFVVRVAGNVVAPSLVGSVEFAAATFGTRLVVVMGHTSCGAVQATIDVITGRMPGPTSENIRDIVDRIRPAAESVVDADPHAGRDELVRRTVRANVRLSVDHLRHGSRLLESLVGRGELVVAGAEYCLVTREVSFFSR
jgi:carbonic anhydrase